MSKCTGCGCRASNLTPTLWFAAILLSVAMRWFALVLAADAPLIGDPLNYNDLAQALYHGQGLALSRAVNGPLALTAAYPPFLPIVLFGIRCGVPLTPLTLTLFNSLIDLASGILLGRLAIELGRRELATPAALTYLVWPSIAFMAPLPYKEGLTIALLLGTLVALLEEARRGGGRWAALSGICAGAMALTQPATTPFLPLSFVALAPCFARRGTWLRAVVASAVFAIFVMMPWWIRNFEVFGTFIPLTSSNWPSLWEGAQLSGGMKYQPFPNGWLETSELTMDQLAKSAALHIIFNDPVGYIERCLIKLPSSLFMTNWAVDQLVLSKGQPYPGLANSALTRLAPTIAELSVIVIAFMNACRVPRSIISRLMWASIAEIVLFGIWFEFSERHRAFMIPFIILAALAVITPDASRGRIS